ncbi:MAG: SAM-dependent methyltransferase [Actinobacteria bacterium]|uniref:SAM-dependent methyltransferase n=1 Tax=Nostocoides veronense TaxID=330836 RepID=UPI0031D37BE6|nr:SAM-dependent methyltransferase [Actinomycetota bacterium]
MQPWVSAWREALYGAQGFYRRPTGPAGHFATSCHGPAGAVLAEALVGWALRDGYAGIVDLGAGRGELLGHLAAAVTQAGCAVQLIGVDIVSRPAGLAEQVEWVQSPGGAALPDLGALTKTLVFANEWLDVIPVPIGQVDDRGVLREVEVNSFGEERLGERAGASATFGPSEVAWARRWYADLLERPGARVEVGLARDRALADLIGRVGSGVVVAVDYGHLVGWRPFDGTLTGYRDGRQVPPLADGSCDLTSHVAVDALPHHRLVTQREALRELGVGGERASYDLARREPAAYLAALQRNSAAAELLNAPLGDFWWAITQVR